MSFDIFNHILSGAPREEYDKKWTEKDFNEMLTAIALYFEKGV